MHPQPAPPRPPRRATWLVILGLAVVIVAVLAVLAAGPDDRDPAGPGTAAADCEEQPPPSEFAVATCDDEDADGGPAAPREP